MSEMYEYDDEDISDLIDIVELQTENDKLNKEIKRLTLSYEDALEDLDKKESIIKEVRENINKKLNINSDYVDYDFGTELLRQELLEILDKGE